MAGEARRTRNHIEITADFGARGQFIKPLVYADTILEIAAKRERVDAVKCRWLVKRDERVSVIPVPAGFTVTVNYGDMRVAFGDQCVSKSKADCAAADHEIVCIYVHSKSLSRMI